MTANYWIVLTGVFFVPALTWVLSYVYLARYFRKWNLAGIKVHENGKYTLSETVFYFNHVLRELGVDSFYALSIFTTLRAFSAPRLVLFEYSQQFFLVLLLAVVGLIFIGAVHRTDLRTAVQDLVQYREIDDEIGFGRHWQMHFVSTLVLILVITFPALLVPGVDLWPLGSIWIAFALISVLLRTRSQAFTERRWLLHGAREIFTYLPLAVIPAYSALLVYTPGVPLRTTGLSIVVMIILAALAAFLTVVYQQSSLAELSRAHQPLPAGYLLASHFFEHVLDYVYIGLLVVVLLSAF